MADQWDVVSEEPAAAASPAADKPAATPKTDDPWAVTAHEEIKPSYRESLERGTSELGPKATAADLPRDSEAFALRSTTTENTPERPMAGEANRGFFEGIQPKAEFDKREALEKDLRAQGLDPKKNPEYVEMVQRQGRAIADNTREGAGFIGIGGETGLAGLVKKGTVSVGARSAFDQIKRGIAWVLDVDPDKAQMALQTGGPIAPSAYMDAPRLQRNVDLARGFGYDPMKAVSQKTADEGAQKMLERTGLTPEQASAERIRLGRVEAPDLEKAGEAVKSAATGELAQKTGKLNEQIAATREGAQVAGEKAVAERPWTIASLKVEQGKVDAEVAKTIDEGWGKVKAIRAIADPEHLGEAMAGKVKEIRQQVSDNAERKYAMVDRAAGDETVNAAPLKGAANDFLEQLPDDLRRNMPSLIKSIEDAKTGTMTFGQIHYLRSQLRDLGYLDNEKLAPSFKRGPYKFLSGVVDQIIHDTGNSPGIQKAAGLLDEADKYYSKEMARFRDHVVQGLVDNLKAGMPPNPTAIARQVVQGGKDNAARLDEIIKIAGPEVTAKIRSADYDDIMQSSREQLSNDISPKQLLAEVDSRYRTGTLQKLWGPEAAKEIVDLTRKLAAREGSFALDKLPPADSFVVALQRANILSEQIDRLVKADPVKIMDQAIKAGNEQIKALTGQFRAEQQNDILKSFTKPQTMAAKAAAALLEPDNVPMLREAVKRWGPESEAVKRIRTVALEQKLQPLLQHGGSPQERRNAMTSVIAAFNKMPRSQQDLLFPNGMADDLKNIFQAIDFRYGKSTSSMPGFAVGEALDKPIDKALPWIYYHRAAAYFVTHPAFVRTIAGGLKAGGPYAEQARNDLAQILMSMMITENATRKAIEQNMQEPPPDPVQPTVPWQQRAAAPHVGGWRGQ